MITADLREAATRFPPDWPTLLDQYSRPLIDGALNLVAAIVILLFGLWVAGFAGRAVRRMAGRHPRIDSTLAAVFASVVRYGLIAFVILAVLNRFGVETTSIVAVLGAAALAIGLALQGTLSNLAAGVMLVLFRPYRIGDFVEVAGRIGSVRDVTLFTTELTTIDNLRVTLPNGLCWGAPMVNYTINDKRRTELVLQVSYDSDLNRAISVIEETLTADNRVFRDPEPFIKVRTLSDFAVDILVRYWCSTDVAFDLQLDVTRAIKEAFDRNGIVIPFPTTLNYEIRKDAR